MKNDRTLKSLLALIAVFLGVIAFQPLWAPHSVQAQMSQAVPLHFEPGFTMLRTPDGSKQLMGRVAIDMRTGDVWGFPTLGQSTYPIADASSDKPPVSKPIYLGKFDFSRFTAE